MPCRCRRRSRLARPAPVDAVVHRLTHSSAMHNNASMNARSGSPAISAQSRPLLGSGRVSERCVCAPRPAPERSGLFVCPARPLRPRGRHHQEEPWPPMGSGSTRPIPDSAPTPATPPLRRRAPRRLPRARRLRRRVRGRASGARSHEVVAMALEAVARVAHRGAASTDNSGDGAGLLTQIPASALLSRRLPAGAAPPARPALRRRRVLPPARAGGAGRSPCAMIEAVLAEDGIPFLGWRDVPDQSGGPRADGAWRRARSSARCWWAVPALAADEDAWERALYLARREMERRAVERISPGFYVCSLSCRTIVYKALLTGTQLPAFYHRLPLPRVRERDRGLPPALLDQHAAELAAGAAVPAAGPQRRDQHALGQPERDDDAPADARVPAVGQNDRAAAGRRSGRMGSDSASLDNAMELLVRSGRDVVHTSMMTIPQAWEKYPDVDPAVKAFYEYHQCMLEPWDGPAALAFTDGVLCGRVRGPEWPAPLPLQGPARRPGGGRARRSAWWTSTRARSSSAARSVPARCSWWTRARRGHPQPRRQARGGRAGGRTHAGCAATWRRWCPTRPACRRHPRARALLRTQRIFGYGFEDLRLVLEPMGSDRRGPGVEHGRRHADPAARGVSRRASTPISGSASRR